MPRDSQAGNRSAQASACEAPKRPPGAPHSNGWTDAVPRQDREPAHCAHRDTKAGMPGAAALAARSLGPRRSLGAVSGPAPSIAHCAPAAARGNRAHPLIGGKHSSCLSHPPSPRDTLSLSPRFLSLRAPFARIAGSKALNQIGASTRDIHRCLPWCVCMSQQSLLITYSHRGPQHRAETPSSCAVAQDFGVSGCKPSRKGRSESKGERESEHGQRRPAPRAGSCQRTVVSGR
jgi:hypothetical protein